MSGTSMATIYARADGAVLTIIGDRSTSTAVPPDTTAAPLTLAFDETTNPEIADALYFRPDEFRLEPDPLGAGALTLRRRGAPVAIAPPGPAAVAARNGAILRARLTEQVAGLRTIATQLDAASKATTALTNAQLTTQLRQTQGALASVTVATLRTIRIAAALLDETD